MVLGRLAEEPGKWYGLPHSSTDFATKLDEALAKRGSNARWWALCTNEQDLFGWSGANTRIDRSHASAALANYISNLQLDGWQCHVVAHSHGGNVLMGALPLIENEGLRKDALTGTATTLGTPFIDIFTTLARRERRASRITAAISWTLFVLSVIAAILFATSPTLGSPSMTSS
jgi:hypothetical protein